MGRKRISPACSMASSSGTPCSRSWLVKSTSRIEFLISMPISAMKPIDAVNEMSLPVSSSISEAADDAERHDGQHDERRFEVAELEHQDREDAEDGDDDRDADAAEGLLRGFLLAAQRRSDSRAASASHRARCDDLLGELRRVVAAWPRRHRWSSARSRLKRWISVGAVSNSTRRELRQRQRRRRQRRHAHLLERREFGLLRDRRAHHDVGTARRRSP